MEGLEIAEMIIGFIVLVFVIYVSAHISNSFFQGLVEYAPEEGIASAGVEKALAGYDYGISWLGVLIAIFIIAVILKVLLGVF